MPRVTLGQCAIELFSHIPSLPNQQLPMGMGSGCGELPQERKKSGVFLRRLQLSTSGSIQSNLAEDPSALSPCLSPRSLHSHDVSQIVFTQVCEQSQTICHQKRYLNPKAWLVLYSFLLSPSHITSDASAEMGGVSTFFLILISIKCLIKSGRKQPILMMFGL